ncbi:MAG: hypothetical protein OEY22_11125 [Candidatus Bathyarchaeota archaeon]|nr:hypothetical protein [Candidatus Bathyarchaeota archaeon]MDH5788428.1 hypothetical protein [Candidatus Bathyarchaeota archaeon]
MKSRLISAVLLTIMLLIIGASIVYADGYGPWSAIKETGYAVTSNWQGMIVPMGETVVVTAGTTDLTITHIILRWHDPGDNPVWEDTVAVTGLTTPNVPPNVPQHVVDWANDNPGVDYLYAQSSHVPNATGDWGVQAFFIGPDGRPKNNLEDVVMIRATSFNSIPEVPLGTIGTLIAMVGAFGFFITRKKTPPFNIVAHRVS